MLATPRPGRWLTAIPLPYTGGDEFWGRDAGLICLGLRELGVDCRFVALGPESQPADAPVILTSLENMRDAAWWRQWQADAVLFYCWAAPRYEPVSRAIHEAGSRLVIRLDTDGISSPRTDFGRYLEKTYCAFRDERKPAAAMQALAKSLLFRLRPQLHDDKVIQHLSHADGLAIESPGARERYQQYLTACGAPALGEKLHVLAHPVAGYFTYHPTEAKQKKLLAIGRWDSHFKDAPLLVKSLAQALRREAGHRATIIGSGSEIIERLLARHAADVRDRIEVRPRVPQAQLLLEYQQAETIVVSSRSESFHIAAAAALCCGCSVAGPASIPLIAWFASEGCGSLAANHTAEDLSAAICSEIAAWRAGRRDLRKFSERWSNTVKVSAVAQQLIDWLAPKL